jgi:hypothetical protein
MATQLAPRTELKKVTSEDARITVPGTDDKIPLPRWARNTLVIATLVSSIGATIGGLVNHFSGDRASDAKSRLADVQIRESVKHSPEDFKTIPVASAPGAENLELRYYASDGCILVARRTREGHLNSSYFVPRINASQVEPPPGPIGGTQYIQSGSTSVPHDQSSLVPVTSSVPLAAFIATPVHQPPPTQSCSGHCLQQHSGEPKISNGNVNGCWIQVIRTWDDGCSQYQWYDTCHSIWDPKIYWSCCKH